jgi:TRAP-type C4-dicarboxylate transport system permease small subunit
MRRLYDRLIDATGMIAGVCILAMAVAITVDVLMRHFGFGTLGWVVEVSEYDLFVVTMLGAPWVLRKGGHVRVDLVVSALTGSARRAAELAAEVIGLLFAAALGIFGLLGTIDSYQSGDKIFKTLTLDEWWLLALVPFCGLLLSVEFCRRIYRQVRGRGLEADRQSMAGM